MPRAPRLRSDQRIAAHMTRAGRFRGIDPSRGSALPSASALLGRVGWALLVGESLRRARKRQRVREEASQAAAASP